MPINIFVSYSHRDEALYDDLSAHLKSLQYEGLINPWHDRKILPGDEFANEISRELGAADVILLLISAAFMASRYCHEIELTRALQRHESGEARVIPVILRPVDWKHSKFAKFTALPKDGKPVTSWADRDEAFLDIADGLRKVANPLYTATSNAHNVAGSVSPATHIQQPPTGEAPKGWIRIEAKLDTVTDPTFQGTFLIFLNDSFVQELKCQQTLDLDVTYGRYTVKIASHNLTSVQCQFDLLPHEHAYLTCGTTTRPSWSKELLFLPNSLLRRIDQMFGSRRLWLINRTVTQ